VERGARKDISLDNPSKYQHCMCPIEKNASEGGIIRGYNSIEYHTRRYRDKLRARCLRAERAALLEGVPYHDRQLPKGKGTCRGKELRGISHADTIPPTPVTSACKTLR
jgi:hypothetical protein